MSEMEIDGYRADVERAANASDGKEVVLNRSAEHASIIVEFLFRKADRRVEIITERLVDATYGTEPVITAVLDFLHRRADARIDVLVEGKIEQKNKLLSAIKNANLGSRVTLTDVPKDIQKSYSDHVIISDAVHFRYQKDRTNCAAMVQFGNPRVGKNLHDEFVTLKAKCAERQTAHAS